jgi:hypothetical protein
MKFVICSNRKTFERPRGAHRKLRYYGEGFRPLFGAVLPDWKLCLSTRASIGQCRLCRRALQLRLHTATRRRLAFTVFVGHAPTYDQRHNLEEGRTLSR